MMVLVVAWFLTGDNKWFSYVYYSIIGNKTLNFCTIALLLPQVASSEIEPLCKE